MHDPNDPKDVRKARKEAQLRQRLADIELGEIMSHKSGRVLIYDLLAYCGVFASPFSQDLALMSHAVGRGDVGRKILADVVRVSPQSYLTMLEEASGGVSDHQPAGERASGPADDDTGSDVDSG